MEAWKLRPEIRPLTLTFSPEEKREIYLNALIMWRVYSLHHPFGRNGAIVGMALTICSADGTPATISNLADMTTLSRREVKRIIEKGLKAGRIKTVQAGKYIGYMVTPEAHPFGDELLSMVYRERRRTIDRDLEYLGASSEGKGG